MQKYKMDFVEIQLQDAESQQKYTLKVNLTDAIKASNGKLKDYDYAHNIFIIIIVKIRLSVFFVFI